MDKNKALLVIIPLLESAKLILDSSSSDELDESENESSNSSLNCDIKMNIKRRRVEDFFEQYSNKEFKDNFKIEHSTFNKIFEIFNSVLFEIKVRSTIKNNKKMLITLWYLTNLDYDYKKMSDLFGISIKSVSIIISSTINKIAEQSSKFVKWPTQEEAKNTANHYYINHGIKHTLGIIDAIQINNEQKDTSAQIILQGVINHQLKFIDIHFDQTNSVNYTGILQKSKLFVDVDEKIYEEQFLVGNFNYKTLKLDWLVTPFDDLADNNLTIKQRKFNHLLSLIHSDIQNVFLMLKRRFSRLKHFKIYNRFAVNCIITSIVLHNICMDNNDFYEIKNKCKDDKTLGTIKNNTNNIKLYKNKRELVYDQFIKDIQ